MTQDRMLQEAVKAIDSGQLSRARDLLTRLLRQDQGNVDYWLYMSAVVETQKERTFCLENVLKYDPGNKTALQGLVILGARPPEGTAGVRPVNERQWETPRIQGVVTEDTAAKKKIGLTPVQIGTIAVFGIISIGLIFLGIFGNPFYEEPLLVANTIPPLLTSGPTPTYLPTNTPVGGITGNISGPTPLVYQLDATYTPTARYIETPHPVIAAFDSGMRSLDSGDYVQAIAFLEQAVDASPDSIDIQYYLGLAYLYNEDYEDARWTFEEIIDVDDTFAPAYVGRAKAFLGMNPDIDVTADLYKAVSIDQDYYDARYAWAEYKYAQGNYADALNDIERLFEIDPENPLGYGLQARIYLAQDLPEEALEAAQQAYNRNLLDEQNYLLLGQAMILNQRYDEAVPLLETYLSHEEEDFFAWYLLGRAHQGIGSAEAAIDIFRYVYAERRNIYEMSYYWGLALIDVGDYETAVERLDVPIDRMPNWLEPYVAQARAYYLNEQYDRAKEIIESGSSRVDETDNEELAAFYYWRAVIYTALGYPSIAQTNWENLLALPPSAVPSEWWSEAQTSVGSSSSGSTTAAPTSTRVPTATPAP